MSDSRTTPPADEGAASPDPGSAQGPDPSHDTAAQDPAAVDAAEAPAGKDPLRGSRTSGIWLSVVAFAVLLVLLAIFILQNTEAVRISFLAFEGEAPLAAIVLIATGAGALLVVMAGSLRILQLRRRVRRERKR